MDVIGQFLDRDRLDRFVWLRGFPDMGERRRSLEAFYNGPVWVAHRDAANATMLDSDDVLLLRPARPEAAFELPRDRPPVGGGSARRGGVAAAVAYLNGDGDLEPAVRTFEAEVAPAIGGAGGSVLAYLVTEPSRNDFPRLPVREGERVLAWFAGVAEEDVLEDVAASMQAAARSAFSAQAVRRIDSLLLAPTARSLLTGRTAPCRRVAA